MHKVYLVGAARPNFMKIAPLYHELRKTSWADVRVIHTGQHYDRNMSDAFFDDLGLPYPDVNLGIGSGSHAEQTGRVMMAFEKLLLSDRPDLVVVVGDVNSTMACTIAASKLGVPVAHLEAGLRSFDRGMPEEINRLVTDAVADILWTPSEDGNRNLLKEGVDESKIELVGNIMIDSLEMVREKIKAELVDSNLGIHHGDYAVVTLHRPSNVDERRKLEKIYNILTETSRKVDIVFPVHPRTRKQMEKFSLQGVFRNGLKQVEPLNYIRFINLLMNAKMLITDSGGIQEETTYLGIPCLTLRDNTERPVTVTLGTNTLCRIDTVEEQIDKILKGEYKTGRIPELWDGQTALRIVSSMERFFSETR